MPRDVPIGNGRLTVVFDREGLARDLYFPHVGQENHLSGNRFRLGVRVDGQFSWVGPDWKIELGYVEDALAAECSFYNERLGIILRRRDAVDFHEPLWISDFEIQNLLPEARRVELFFGQDLDISGNSVGDTAAYDPATGGLVHYKSSRYFLANASVAESSGAYTDGFAQFATGTKKTGDKEGAWRDAEDGQLSGNAIAQGSVDSVGSVAAGLPGLGSARAAWWLCAGESWSEVRRIDGLLRHKRPGGVLKRTVDYWRLWARKDNPPLNVVSRRVAALYRRSLLVLAVHQDADGGVVAANDSDVIQFNRDTYSYVWPRDGALCANALDMAGYAGASRRFFNFCARALNSESYFLHKYLPDGHLASSWHPWLENGEPILPIQEDETGLVLWALWRHFAQYRDVEFIRPLYKPLIKRCADFLADYRDPDTGLPKPSYDLWEERRGVHAFTVGAVFGGLTAAAAFTGVFGEESRAERYRKAAAEMRDAATNHLWRQDWNRFARALGTTGAGLAPDPIPDPVQDMSVLGLTTFGMYAASDPRVVATAEALKAALRVDGGYARYENDYYYRVDDSLPGNPWFVTTLMVADWLVARNQDGDGREALDLLEWSAARGLPSGVLPEQLHPRTGAPLSVSPLAWSHAAFVTTTQNYLRRQAPELFREHRDDWIGRLFDETCDAIHGACKVK